MLARRDILSVCAPAKEQQGNRYARDPVDQPWTTRFDQRNAPSLR